jgi:hypothetical protein
MGGRMREDYYEPGQGDGGYGYEEGRPWGAEGGPFEGRSGVVGGVREEVRRGEEEGRGAAAAEAGMGGAAPEGGAAAYEGYEAPLQGGHEEGRGVAGRIGVGGGAGYRKGGAAAAAPAGEGDVCGRQEFVQEEDRPVVKERVERCVTAAGRGLGVPSWVMKGARGWSVSGDRLAQGEEAWSVC